MKNLNILKKLIVEELAKVTSENAEGMQNYMFFQNLKTIHQAVGEMLQMDPNVVDEVLSNGHGWAVDHIATSADDVSEVHGFLKNRQPLNEELDHKRDMLKSIKDSVDDLWSWEFSLINITKEQEETLTKVAVFLQELVNSADQASDESNQAGNDDLYEKHLTKAELKKREEVAKGIHKENPKMPMNKKMAIATAVAKKVAEAKKGFTSKFDNDPKLKGKQKNLPDALQAKIVKSK
jgi:hypothetical protein